MSNILVIGAGAMGAAFTFPLIDNNHQVTLTEPYSKVLQKKLLKKNKFHPALKLNLSKREADKIIQRAMEQGIDVLKIQQKFSMLAPTLTALVSEYKPERK